VWIREKPRKIIFLWDLLQMDKKKRKANERERKVLVFAWVVCYFLFFNNLHMFQNTDQTLFQEFSFFVG
jgi:hypothetical protein